MSSLAGKLNRLFATMRKREDAEHSNTSVAEAIRARHGVAISHTYIWQLRTGRRDNPSIQHLTALGAFFGVPVAYFLDEVQSARIDRDLELVAIMREARVTEIASRVAGLSSSGKATVGELVTQLWQLEHPRPAARGAARHPPPRTPAGRAPGRYPPRRGSV